MYRGQAERHDHLVVPTLADSWKQVVAVVVVLAVSEALTVRAVAAFAAVSGDWALRDVDAMVGEATCAARLEEAAVGCGLEVGMAEAWAAVQALEEVLVLEGS